jgi:hypothetical protein
MHGECKNPTMIKQSNLINMVLGKCTIHFPLESTRQKSAVTEPSIQGGVLVGTLAHCSVKFLLKFNKKYNYFPFQVCQ